MAINDGFLPVKLRITFESDWHVGTGAGIPGSVDRLVRRDVRGLPIVPGKTVKGIWRDACETLAQALDPSFDDWVTFLFGAAREEEGGKAGQGPTPAVIRVTTANLTGPPITDPRIRQALTFVKPGVAIDERTGAARSQALRFTEMARTGQVLEANVSFDGAAGLDEDSEPLAAAFLTAGAALVERLGGDRRRGAGACTFTLWNAAGNELNIANAVAKLRGQPVKVEQLRPKSDEPGSSSDSTPAASVPIAEEWVRIPLTLKLLSPLAVGRSVVGNVVETLDYLPGTLLLPIISRTFASIGARRLVRQGRLRVLPATIQIEGERGEPIPFALSQQKGFETPETMINVLLDQRPEGTQLKQCRGEYAFVGQDGRFARVKTPLTAITHNTVNDHLQRPTKRVGGVYTYEAIKAEDDGQPVVLMSEVRMPMSEFNNLSEETKRSLNGKESFGRSRSDEYGRVEITAGVPEAIPDSDRDTVGELIVRCCSDVLLRSDSLAHAPSVELFGDCLQDRLIQLDPTLKGTLKLEHVKSSIRLRRTDSWQVQWGLPRPSLVGIEAGSCFKFNVGQVDRARLGAALNAVAAAGLGERVAEGFGQLAFDDPLAASSPSKWEAWNKPEVSPLVDDSQSTNFPIHLETAELEAFRLAIRQAARAVASSEASRIEHVGITNSQPEMSQLGGLRTALLHLKDYKSGSTVTGWLKKLGANNNRAKKWPRGSIAKLIGLIETDTRVWEILEPEQKTLAAGMSTWPCLAKARVEDLKTTLWAEAVRTLLLFCMQHRKRQSEKPADQGEPVHGENG